MGLGFPSTAPMSYRNSSAMSPNRSGKNKQAEEEAEDSSTPPTRFAPEEEAVSRPVEINLRNLI